MAVVHPYKRVQNKNYFSENVLLNKPKVEYSLADSVNKNKENPS